MVTEATVLLHDLNSKKTNMLTLSPLGECVGEALSTIPQPETHPSRNPAQVRDISQTQV